MAGRVHHYVLNLRWTGNTGTGTSGYRQYGRDYEISADGKPTLNGSADPTYLGDAACWNPEELLLAALAACHQLWFLHCCADAGVVVLGYEDQPNGDMQTDETGAGQFTEVTLRPLVALAEGADATQLPRLHEKAHDACFIARSVNFPVSIVPRVK